MEWANGDYWEVWYYPEDNEIWIHEYSEFMDYSDAAMSGEAIYVCDL